MNTRPNRSQLATLSFGVALAALATLLGGCASGPSAQEQEDACAQGVSCGENPNLGYEARGQCFSDLEIACTYQGCDQCQIVDTEPQQLACR